MEKQSCPRRQPSNACYSSSLAKYPITPETIALPVFLICFIFMPSAMHPTHLSLVVLPQRKKAPQTVINWFTIMLTFILVLASGIYEESGISFWSRWWVGEYKRYYGDERIHFIISPTPSPNNCEPFSHAIILSYCRWVMLTSPFQHSRSPPLLSSRNICSFCNCVISTERMLCFKVHYHD